MKNTKVYQIIQSLSKNEKQQFRLWLSSPYCCNNAHIQWLGNYLLDSTLQRSSLSLEKPDIWSSFENKPYNEISLNNRISDLYQTTLRFLAQQDLKQQPFEYHNMAVDALKKRNQTQILEKEVKKGPKLLAKTPHRDAEYLYDQFKLYNIYKPTADYRVELQQKSDYLDHFYLAEKLRLCCNLINSNQFIATKYEFDILDALLKYVHEHYERYSDIPAIIIYVNIILFLKDEAQDGAFSSAKLAIQKSASEFSKEEKSVMYDYLMNFCIKKVNKGFKNYFNDLFEIYKDLLDQSIILQNGKLSHQDYKNITTTGLRAKNYDWVKSFIQNYKSLIDKNIREDAYRYNLGCYYYEVNEYDKAMTNLLQVNLSAPQYYIGIKTVLLKCFYELNEIEPFISNVEAFKVYLSRNKQLPEYWKEANRSFIKYMERLNRLKVKKLTLTKVQLEDEKIKLNNKLNETNNFPSKDWIIDKITAL